MPPDDSAVVRGVSPRLAEQTIDSAVTLRYAVRRTLFPRGHTQGERGVSDETILLIVAGMGVLLLWMAAVVRRRLGMPTGRVESIPEPGRSARPWGLGFGLPTKTALNVFRDHYRRRRSVPPLASSAHGWSIWSGIRPSRFAAASLRSPDLFGNTWVYARFPWKSAAHSGFANQHGTRSRHRR
jgi:hypothetical protein